MTLITKRVILAMDSALYRHSRAVCFCLPDPGFVVCGVCGHHVREEKIWEHHGFRLIFVIVSKVWQKSGAVR